MSELLDWQAVRYGDSPETHVALNFYRERGWPVDRQEGSDTDDRIDAFKSGWRALAALRAPEGGTMTSGPPRCTSLPLGTPHADLVELVLEWQAAHRNEQEGELALRRVNAAEDALLAWAEK